MGQTSGILGIGNTEHKKSFVYAKNNIGPHFYAGITCMHLLKLIIQNHRIINEKL